MHRWRGLLVPLTLVATTLVAPAAGAAAKTTGPAQAVVTVAADHSADDGPLAKDVVLNASQGGYLTLENLHVLADHADELAGLGLRELRIDHVFDDSFYDVVRGVDRYDFSRLDAVLEPLVEHGIRPWITLSYMPSELGPSVYGPPSDYAAWGRAVEAMVRHYAQNPDQRYRGWNWEVWNEPDDGNNFWSGTTAQYNTLYAASAAAVRRADPTAQVGGPGVATPTVGLFGRWLDYIAANPDVPCDFVSWHSYGPNDFASTADIRAELARRQIPAKPLYITEWNSTASMNNGPGTFPDTHQTASYAIQRMNDALRQPGLRGVHYFSGLEGWRPTADFNGDLGLLTVDGRRKAVANAFAMLDSMGDTRLRTTVDTPSGPATSGLVSTDRATGRTSILLWNNTLTNTTFRPSVSRLPFGSAPIAVTHYDVDAANSSSDRASGYAGQRPSPHERLTPSSRTVVAAAPSWSGTVTLPPNGVTLIELEATSGAVGPIPVAPMPTTVNLARDAAVTPSSSYTEPRQGWSPQALVDGRRHSYAAANEGDPTMGWTSAGHATASATESVRVDLGARRNVDAVTLWPRDDQTADGLSFPVDFTLAGSDDALNWTTLTTQTGYGQGAPVTGPQTFAVPGTYRYLRLVTTKLGLPVVEASGPTYRLQLAELEVSRAATNIRVPNPGFETGQLSGWTATGDATITGTGGRSGARAATFAGAGNGVVTTVTGLSPGTTYTLAGQLRTATAGDPVHLGVKNHGGPELSTAVATTSYSPTAVTFTTGPGATSAQLYAYKNSGRARAWFDDFTLVREGTGTAR